MCSILLLLYSRIQGTSDGSPTPNSAAASPNMTVYLNRHTGLDRTCRVKFNMKIGDGDEYRTESGLKDEMSDQDGKSFGWMPRLVLYILSLILSKVIFQFFFMNDPNFIVQQLDQITFSPVVHNTYRLLSVLTVTYQLVRYIKTRGPISSKFPVALRGNLRGSPFGE